METIKEGGMPENAEVKNGGGRTRAQSMEGLPKGPLCERRLNGQRSQPMQVCKRQNSTVVNIVLESNPSSTFNKLHLGYLPQNIGYIRMNRYPAFRAVMQYYYYYQLQTACSRAQLCKSPKAGSLLVRLWTKNVP